MQNSDNRTYYDAFADRYDERRTRGYHRLIDEQATELVRHVAVGKDTLEVGCGTGLILERVARFAGHAEGVDLSPGMLEHASRRGLKVQVADATSLPFDDDSFDVAFSFKVLAHVADLHSALQEMARVVRPGGHVVFDLYNRNSLRYLGKKITGARKTSTSFDEAAIMTRYVSDDEAQAYFPAGTRLVSRAGIRIATPHPVFLRVPGFGQLWTKLEWSLMESPFARYAGFLVYTIQNTTVESVIG